MAEIKTHCLADALEALIGAIYLECGFEKSTDGSSRN